jgi:hypothetical protein
VSGGVKDVLKRGDGEMETLEDADDEKVELAEDTKLIVQKSISLEPFRQQLQTLIKGN